MIAGYPSLSESVNRLIRTSVGNLTVVTPISAVTAANSEKSTVVSTIPDSTLNLSNLCADTGNSILKLNIPKQRSSDLTNSNLKSESLQQLSTNALPSYTPGSPPTANNPFEYHSCPDCGDTFTLRSSLTFHLERRSVLIKFFCDACKTFRSFYNRCALKSYIRAHTDKQETSDIKKATIVPLPRILMDGLQNEIANALDEEMNDAEDTNQAPPTDLLEFSIKEIDGTVVVRDKVPPTNAKKVKCADCNEEFPSFEARKEHLTNNDKIPVVVSQCNTCQMICPSKCNLKAHQRIHLQVSPYVCPECGESPNAYFSKFLQHVNFKCFHNSRSVGYKCPVCKRVSPTSETLLKHMELHTEKYLKCEACPRAYMTKVAFEEHIKDVHVGKSVKFNAIYKCSLCDIVFLSGEQMMAHRSTHLKDQVCEYIFNCMQCGKSLESKEILLEHIKAAHVKLYRQIINNLPSDPNETSNSYKGKLECMLCYNTFQTQQAYNVHVLRGHMDHNEQCTYCHMIISNRQEMMNHGKKHLRNNYFVCLLCKNKKMKDSNALGFHLKAHVEKLRCPSACPACNQILSGVEKTLSHLRSEHFLPMRVDLLPSKSEQSKTAESLACPFCENRYGSATELSVHVRNKHMEAAKGSPTQSKLRESSSADAPPAKKPHVDGNACAKCDFHSSDREAFKKHLITHKNNKQSFQCQECGLCFVVEPALSKHLKIIHKVGDPKKYMEEEGTNFTPDAKKAAEVASCDSLICSVCFTTFSTEAQLKTHMRSHGMAFIQANKTNSVS